MGAIREPGSPLPVHADVHFEPTDVNSRDVVWLGVGVLVGAWICAALLYFFFAWLMNYRAAAGPPLPLRAQGHVLQPPEPRIQTSPRRDVQEMRAGEAAELNGYAWVDRQKGIVSIPIDRAIDLTVSRGIPPLRAPKSLELNAPVSGSRETGFEGKVEPEPR